MSGFSEAPTTHRDALRQAADAVREENAGARVIAGDGVAYLVIPDPDDASVTHNLGFTPEQTTRLAMMLTAAAVLLGQTEDDIRRASMSAVPPSEGGAS